MLDRHRETQKKLKFRQRKRHHDDITTFKNDFEDERCFIAQNNLSIL